MRCTEVENNTRDAEKKGSQKGVECRGDRFPGYAAVQHDFDSCKIAVEGNSFVRRAGIILSYAESELASSCRSLHIILETS